MSQHELDALDVKRRMLSSPPRRAYTVVDDSGWSYRAHLVGNVWTPFAGDQDVCIHEYGPDDTFIRYQLHNVCTLAVVAQPHRFPVVSRFLTKARFSPIVPAAVAAKFCSDWLSADWPQFHTAVVGARSADAIYAYRLATCTRPST